MSYLEISDNTLKEASKDTLSILFNNECIILMQTQYPEVVKENIKKIAYEMALRDLKEED